MSHNPFVRLLRDSFIEWRFPLEPDEIMAANRGYELKIQDERTEAEEEELQKMLADQPVADDIRIDLRAPSSLDLASHTARIRMSDAYIDSLNVEGPAERGDLRVMVAAWSANITAATGVGLRRQPVLDDPLLYEPSDKLDDWQDPAVYFKEVPAALHLKWNLAAMNIAPGVFGDDVSNFFLELQRGRPG